MIAESVIVTESEDKIDIIVDSSGMAGAALAAASAAAALESELAAADSEDMAAQIAAAVGATVAGNYLSTLKLADVITKGPWVDVRAFGAKGDGITNDTAAIQAAINSILDGGTVIFPYGIYSCGSFSYPEEVALNGISSSFLVGGNTIAIPSNNQTQGPIKYYVSTSGDANNHGLSASCPLSKPSDALRRMPDIILHDVVVHISNGTYVENTMLDEWGRATGIDIGNKVIMPTRIAVGATYPDGYDFSMNKKWGKLSFIGESEAGVVIDGDSKASRDGIKSRSANVFIANMTLQNFHTGLLAHEGGAIAGYNITAQDCNVLMLAESQSAKIEIDGITLRRGVSYSIYCINSQIVITDLLLDVDSSAGIIMKEGYVSLEGEINVKSSNLAGQIYNGTFGFSGTLTGASTAYGFYFYSGYITLSGVYKNIRSAFEMRGSATVSLSSCSLFDMDVPFICKGGSLFYTNIDSMDGVTQKYNRVSGGVVEGGNVNISPYLMLNQYKVKGPSGSDATNLIVKGLNVIAEACANKPQSVAAYSSTGWSAGTLGSEINGLINLTKGLSDTVNWFLTPVFIGISPMTAYQVTDCRTKMQEIASALATAGMFRSALTATWYPATAANNSTGHDIVRAGYNTMLTYLISKGYMEP